MWCWAGSYRLKSRSIESTARGGRRITCKGAFFAQLPWGLRARLGPVGVTGQVPVLPGRRGDRGLGGTGGLARATPLDRDQRLVHADRLAAAAAPRPRRGRGSGTGHGSGSRRTRHGSGSRRWSGTGRGVYVSVVVAHAYRSACCGPMAAHPMLARSPACNLRGGPHGLGRALRMRHRARRRWFPRTHTGWT